jgi:hypothetical protein
MAAKKVDVDLSLDIATAFKNAASYKDNKLNWE